MKLVVLFIALCGVVSGDISEIINHSREYLPPSREYLPPLLPEYQQTPPETSTYVQDPPILTNLVEVLSTIGPLGPALEDSLRGEDIYIPVQVVIEKGADSASIRQYLPPFTIPTTVIPQPSEKIVDGFETTSQVIVNEENNEVLTGNIIQSREFIESTTQEITVPSNVPTEGTLPLEEDTDAVSNETTVFTTTISDIEIPVTTEGFVSTIVDTVDDDSDVNESAITTTPSSSASLDDISTESVTDAVPTVLISESITSTTVTDSASEDTVSTERSTDDIPSLSTTNAIEITTTDFSPVEAVSTESNPDDIQNISTTVGVEVTTLDSALDNNVNKDANLDGNDQFSIPEETPTTTSVSSIDTFTTESEPANIQILSTTIPEYIQNERKLQVSTEQIVLESEKDLIHSNIIETNEVNSPVAVIRNEVSTPETLLLEDGYHYSIPSIIFGSINI